MSDETLVDVDTLRSQVQEKYREVALDPHGTHHFHTGRPLAARLGYDHAVVEALPDRAVESFAGIGNPFSLRTLVAGERGDATKWMGVARSPPLRAVDLR